MATPALARTVADRRDTKEGGIKQVAAILLVMASQDHPPKPDGRATRWAGQRELRRREFVDAAVRIIFCDGPDVSTEQIATAAGVARTQLYRHFTDATDLKLAIAARARELLSRELALWQLAGTPMQMIHAGVDGHLTWLTQHRNLARYLRKNSLLTASDELDLISDLRTAIGAQLTEFLEAYRKLLGADTKLTEISAFSIVGMVDAATANWLDTADRIPRTELVDHLAQWVWHVLDDALRSADIALDPHAPLTPPRPGPDLTARSGTPTGTRPTRT